MCARENGTHPSTFWITHVDSVSRLYMVRRSLRTADIGICMSRDTMQDLIRRGIPGERLCYILPAVDGFVKPRRFVIGLTTKVYPNGCKREDVLLWVAQNMRLDDFLFDISGSGWESVIPKLREAGADVRYDPGSKDYLADYSRIVERIPTFDYYLYLGLDEGSLGFLDALSAGVPTIVTPQGYHLDIPNGIDFAFWDGPDLMKVLKQIQSTRKRKADSVADLVWRTYAKKHALLWRTILAGDRDGLVERLYPGVPDVPERDSLPRRDDFYQRRDHLMFYLRPLHRLWEKIIKRGK